MKKVILLFFLVLCLTKTSVASADYTPAADWVEGTWQYYQNDGSTWLFDVNAVKNGSYYEFRLSRWNTNIYSNLEIGRLVSQLIYDRDQNLFHGDHYRVEDGIFYDKVIVEIVNQDYLVYRGTTQSGVNGQSLRRNPSCSPSRLWKSHGEYVRCVSHEAERLVEQGVLTQEEGDALVSSAAQSTVGKN